jgi:hypothetical protein
LPFGYCVDKCSVAIRQVQPLSSTTARVLSGLVLAKARKSSNMPVVNGKARDIVLTEAAPEDAEVRS